jgi:putative FmdB family regulatory protein
VPTYQYSCNDCGHFFEIVQSFSDDSLTVCPECEGRLRKVFNAVGVVFKGSGFYRTDSRTQKVEAGASSEGSASNGSSESKGGSDSGSRTGTESGSGTGSGKGSKSADTSSGTSSSSAPAPA